MNLWSMKKRVVFLIAIGVVLITLIAVPIVLIQLKSVPDIEDILRVNNQDHIMSEFGSLKTTQGDLFTYFEQTDEYFNYASGTSSGESSDINYVVNAKAFSETDGKFYYDYLFDGKILVTDNLIDNLLGLEAMFIDAYDDSGIKRKDGKYFMTFERENGYDINKTVFECYFSKKLYLEKIKYTTAGHTSERKFTYGEKLDYPEFIKNYDSGDRVTVTVINLLTNKTEEFELKKGFLVNVQVVYNANRACELYIDEACTAVYGANFRSTEPVNEDITLYIGERITK